MNDPAVQSYIDKWLDARPAQRLSLPFLDPAQREVHLALAALEHELVNAAYAIAEPEVAVTKLKWWAEELAGAVVSGGRHPLVKVLFADAPVRDFDPQLWLAPVTAALAQLDTATPADFPAQLAAAQAFHGALATLETRLWFGPTAEPVRAAAIASVDHLLTALGRLQNHPDAERLALPMTRLARHGLDREALGIDTPARREAVHEQLTDLSEQWRAAWRQPGPLSVFRGLDARLDGHWLRKTRRARQPLTRLRKVQHHQMGPGTLRRAWSAARAANTARVD
jgi:phytoene synthase